MARIPSHSCGGCWLCKSLAYLLLYFVYFMSMLLRSCCCNSKLLWINITEIIYIDFSCCSQAKWAFRKTCINTLSLAFVVFWGSHCYFFLSKPIHSAQLNRDYLRSTFSVETITEIVFIRVSSFALFRGFLISEYSLFCLNGAHFHF